MTEEQREILRDLEVVVAVLENTDNVYCQNILKKVGEKLVEEFKK